MRRIVFVLLALPSTCLQLAGCYSLRRRLNGPDIAPLVISSGSELNDLGQRIHCYRAAATGLSPNNTYPCTVGGTTINFPASITADQRNSIQNQLISAADRRYSKTKQNLIAAQNSLTFGAELTGVTLSAVSAIIGDAETKTILSTTSSLVQSTNVAIKKNFLADKTSSALINQMDASRAAILKEITVGQAASPIGYSFELALRDSLRYDEAGSIHDALIALDTTAADKKKTNEAELAGERIRNARNNPSH